MERIALEDSKYDLERRTQMQTVSGDLEERTVLKEVGIMVSGSPYKWADDKKEKKLMIKGGTCDVFESPRLGLELSIGTC